MINKRREKTLGTDKKKRRYDLPLSRSGGGGFLILLIAMMSFLAVLAITALFTLGAMTERWTSGLENRITVEIPATETTGKIRSRDTIYALQNNLVQLLSAHPDVSSVKALSDQDIQRLVGPWLGDITSKNNIPVPGLISLEVRSNSEQTIKGLQAKIHNVADNARLDTHKSWLNDLLSFTSALQLAAMLVTIVISITAITAVAGAIRSRIAVYKTEVELLHLMGASDAYIARQFQRYAMITGFQGAFLGVFVSAIALYTLNWMTGEMGVNLLPEFSLNTKQILIIASLPVASSLIAGMTSRQTVLHSLGKMP